MMVNEMPTDEIVFHYRPEGSAYKPTAITTSVIIVNYNGRDYIGACLDALQATLDEQCEIVVVDNASTDDSVAYLESCYPHVKVVHNPHNSGFGDGNNLGAEQTQGKYLVFLNPDTVVTAGWLEPMIELLDSWPQIGMVTSKILLMDEPELINTCGNEMHFTGLTLCRGARAQASDYGAVSVINAVSGAAFAMRKSVFYEVGGFDPLLFMYMDDTDLSLRVRQAGYSCVYTPDSVVYHDYSLNFGPRKTYYQERNRYIMMLKTWRWRTLALMLLPLLLAELVTWGFVLMKERKAISNKLLAYRDTIRTWPEIMRERRSVQQRRKLTDHEVLTALSYKIDFGQTGQDFITLIAHIAFDLPFFIMQRMLLLCVRW